MVIKEQFRPNGDLLGYAFECPGCGGTHVIEVPRWKFNNDLNKPTFSPSIKVMWGKYADKDFIEHEDWDQSKTAFLNQSGQCHFLIREGEIQFCSDCTHSLTGKTVELNKI